MIIAQVIYSEDNPLKIISLVSQGANKENLVKLAEDKPIMMLSFNNELQEVTGAVLIPQQRIYRTAEFFEKTLGIKEDGEIFFSAEDIKLFATHYLKDTENAVNLEHSIAIEDGDVRIIESWFITTDNDKAFDMGFSPEKLIKGTWMMTQKINNADLWADIKAGLYNSYSIEGSPIIEMLFTTVLELKHQYTRDEIADEIVRLIVEYKKTEK